MQKIWQIISYPFRMLIKGIVLLLVYTYRYTISPMTPSSCRHVPTCSEYMIEAIKTHGAFNGLWLGLKRLSKCHPWGTHGYDPVPPKDSKGEDFYKEMDVD